MSLPSSRVSVVSKENIDRCRHNYPMCFAVETISVHGYDFKSNETKHRKFTPKHSQNDPASILLVSGTVVSRNLPRRSTILALNDSQMSEALVHITYDSPLVKEKCLGAFLKL
ncbi:hypothetical protein BaRGS_00022101 [Batillaria attramentaria]|uniref:Uncharacterized protein n=1 Tax=Batillaria attramentaria TaxID=370345 RepID=A0ABD0KI61_9CAEN